MKSSVGFVGLGRMGKPMVKNLLEKGESVVVYDKAFDSLDWAEEEISHGKKIKVGSGYSDFSHCEVVLLMLPDSKSTNLAMLGGDDSSGLIGSLKPGATAIDMGSSDPAQTVVLCEKCASKDVVFFDAPVSGSVAKAEEGGLTIMVGRKNLSPNVEALLIKLGSNLIKTGEVGSAHAIKAINNYIYAAGLLALCEGVCMAEKLELDLSVFSDVLKLSSGRNVAVDTKLDNYIIPRCFQGGFSLGLQHKDLLTALRFSGNLGLDLPLLSHCEQVWREAVSKNSFDEDNTSIMRFIESTSS